MNLTFDQLNQVKSFDVIFVGHLASVAANLFTSVTKDQYKSLVLKSQKSVVETSLAPLHPDEIKITKKIKYGSVHIKESKIVSIKPISKQIQVEGGKIYEYKYLVYTGNVEDWVDYQTIKTLQQALSNQYSLVYSNIKKRDLTNVYKQIASGNIVFYVPNGRHSGYDNFNFLCVYQKFQQHLKSSCQDYAKSLNFKIVLEGTDFFPFCKEADTLIKKEIHERGIEVSYNSKLTKIDYLRRTLAINDNYQVPYNVLYCVVPQKTPSILQSAQIDPYTNNPRTLQNKRFKNIFVYGADIYPTTHTFEAIQYQSHVVAKNLDHMLTKTGQISLYNGLTQIPIYINTNEVVDVVHYYSKKQQCQLQELFEPMVTQKCSWLVMALNKLTKVYMAQSYYNYSSFGAPYYIFSPNLSSVKLLQEEKVDHSDPLVTGNNKKVDKMDDEDSQKINHTADRGRHVLRIMNR